MNRIAAVAGVLFCLIAGAEAPSLKEQGTSQQKKAPPAAKEPTASGQPLTLETLDRYIQYRRESDPITRELSNAMLQQANGPGVNLMEELKKVKQADDTVRAKYGLSGEDFSPLDQMIRGICDSRFMPESAAMKVMFQRFEAQASGPKSLESDMAKGMLNMLRKQRAESEALPEQRERYGDATVHLVLTREKELKEIWVLKDAAAAKAFQALDQAPSMP